MASRRVRPLARSVAIAGFAVTVSLTSLVSGALAAEQRFDITGTVERVNGNLLTIVTSDVIGKPQAITVDVSQIPDLQITPNTPIQLTIMSRENDSYLATAIVRESPFVNGADFGVREEFTTRQDSVQAGVGNVPADDEALNQQHRSRDLHHRDNNDDDNHTRDRNGSK
jgi:hypothetical protein